MRRALKTSVCQEKLESLSQEAVAVFTYEDHETRTFKRFDRAMGGQLAKLKAQKEFLGKTGQAELLRIEGPIRWLLLVGLGERRRATVETLRRAAGIAAKTARQKAKSLLLIPPALPRVAKPAIISALVEGAQLASYRFVRYKTQGLEDLKDLTHLLVLVEERREGRAAQKAIDETLAIVEGTLLARDLVNTPACDMTPADLEREARRIATKHKLSFTVFDAKELEKRRMHAILAVGKGSAVPPRMLILEYKKRGAKRHTVFCGKGVCYDSGGYNLKQKMLENMKDDMGGAAALLGMLDAVATLGLKQHVTVIIGAVENMIDGKAYRAGDIVRASNGKTIEVANTDAEGRIVLADCLSYASTRKPDTLIDLATLTGAAMVALGPLAAAVCSPNDALAEKLVALGERTGDRAWRLPLWEDYKEDVKSEIADVKNLGHSFFAGVQAGAVFLQEFVEQPAHWAHIDIGAAVMEDRERAYIPKGATGWGVRILSRLLSDS
ncbi:leucyl aminopeptidase [Candidatus Woesearchaeota archaeon]|nr:MAG: leucyl aminopeptidase [Candidatus Woesearchaeota archaeon]